METILITGANRGIGLEMTRQYIQAGGHVLACCRLPEDALELQSLKQQHSGKVDIYKLDVSDLEAIKGLHKLLKDQPIDIFINNAGVYGKTPSGLQDFNQFDDFVSVYKVNMIAPFFLTQCFLENIKRSKRKRLVNISSKMGSISENTSGGSYAYRSSKAGLNAIVKSLSIDLKGEGITVVAIHPGWVATEMGGENAQLTPKESVEQIIRTLSSLTIKDTGHFLALDGTQIPW